VLFRLLHDICMLCNNNAPKSQKVGGYTELYSTPHHVRWFTILYVEALKIFNFINPVRYRFRQSF